MQKAMIVVALALGSLCAFPALAQVGPAVVLKDSTRTQAKVIPSVDIGQIIDAKAREVVAAAAPSGGMVGVEAFFKKAAGKTIQLGGYSPAGYNERYYYYNMNRAVVRFSGDGSYADVNFCFNIYRDGRILDTSRSFSDNVDHCRGAPLRLTPNSRRVEFSGGSSPVGGGINGGYSGTVVNKAVVEAVVDGIILRPRAVFNYQQNGMPVVITVGADIGYSFLELDSGVYSVFDDSRPSTAY